MPRRLFRRLFGRVISDAEYEQKLQEILVADTPADQARLARELSAIHRRKMGSASNAAQVAVWEMEGRLAETMRQEFGRTNTTIGDGIGGLREQLLLLQGTFSEAGERLDHHEGQIADHAARIQALEAYAAGVPDDERRRYIRAIEEHAEQMRTIQEQLAELLAQRERGGDGT